MNKFLRRFGRRELQFYMGLILAVSIISIGIIWMVFDKLTLEKQAVKIYTQQAEMIGSTTKPALMFRDRRLASELLDQLSVNKEIVCIHLYDADNKLLAEKSENTNHNPSFESIRGYLNNSNVENGKLKITNQVIHREATVGHVHIEYSLASLGRHQSTNIINILAIALITLLIGFTFTNRLQNRLVESQEKLRAATKQAKQASRAKSDFLSTMSHELRTPIHGIIGLQQLIYDEDKNLSAKQKKNLTLAQHSAKSLQVLVNDVLDLAKIEAGGMKLLNTSFDLKGCIRDAIIPLAAMVEEKGLSILLHINDVPKSIISDEARLRQILLNLIGNAVKFTENGKICIYVKTSNKQLHFSIRDTGIGIPEEELKKIFDPFTQLSNQSNSNPAGTGLGTSISKRFIEMMGGDISIVSHENEGTSVNFSIPLTTASPDKFSYQIDSIRSLFDQLKSIENKKVSPTSSLKVLLAEDDPIGQRIASHSLRRAGMQVTIVDDGQSAWDKLQQESYDLLITDLRMPGIDGIELTRRVREAEEDGKHIAIIGLSAHALDEVAKECLEAGMNDFITKPVEPKRVLDTAMKVMSKL